VLSVRNQSLAILPAHRDLDIADIAVACSDLGYRPTQTSTASIATVAVGTPLLLVLAGRPNADLEALLREARSRNATPILATLLGTAPSWDQPLSELCCDCVRWPCEPGELGFRLARLCRSLPATAEHHLDPALRGLLANLNLIGRSQSFTRTMGALGHMLDCAAPVLIEGETGTGKELVARALHYLGPRAGGPFVPVKCGALPDHLLENELFGHERGAYTDAKSSSIGAIGAAASGTLFLDEIETLSPKAQAALLRFLQDRAYRPLGSQRTQQSDARVIAASNADLRALSAGPDFARISISASMSSPCTYRPCGSVMATSHCWPTTS